MVISLDLPISELILEIKGIPDQSFLWLRSVRMVHTFITISRKISSVEIGECYPLSLYNGWVTVDKIKWLNSVDFDLFLKSLWVSKDLFFIFAALTVHLGKITYHGIFSGCYLICTSRQSQVLRQYVDNCSKCVTIKH